MSRSHHDGHGRCHVCGDAGAARRARERAGDDTATQADDDEHALFAISEMFTCDCCWRIFPCDDEPVADGFAANDNAPLRATIRERLVS